MLSQKAVSSLIDRLTNDNPLEISKIVEDSKETDEENNDDEALFENTAFKGHVLKLLMLQLSSEEIKFSTLLDEHKRRELIDYLLIEGSESIEGMSSRKLKLIKSKSVDLAFALPVMQLEFILNHRETLVKE